MNKYAKMAIEKKLTDNNIKNYEKFTVSEWHPKLDIYSYDGDDIIKGNDCDSIVNILVPTNLIDFLESKLIKLPWIPQLNDWYLVLDINYANGYVWRINLDRLIDRRVIKYGITAQTEEKIIELRNQQDWWDNNETTYNS